MCVPWTIIYGLQIGSVISRPRTIAKKLNLTPLKCWKYISTHKFCSSFSNQKSSERTGINTRWFKYDRDCNRLVYTQIVPVIFEPNCRSSFFDHLIRDSTNLRTDMLRVTKSWVRRHVTCDEKRNEKTCYVWRKAEWEHMLHVTKSWVRRHVTCDEKLSENTCYVWRKAEWEHMLRVTKSWMRTHATCNEKLNENTCYVWRKAQWEHMLPVTKSWIRTHVTCDEKRNE